MKKPIEFDANVRCGAKPDHHPTGYIPVPDDRYKWIPMHVVGGQIESVKRFHVILSSVEDPERSRREPDYKAMWKDIRRHVSAIGSHLINASTIYTEIQIIEAKHTPQDNQTGEKKEKK